MLEIGWLVIWLVHAESSILITIEEVSTQIRLPNLRTCARVCVFDSCESKQITNTAARCEISNSQIERDKFSVESMIR